MNKQTKLYPLMVALVVFFQLLCFIYARRQVDIFEFPINMSGIIFPLDIYLIEIIAECYGFQFARQVIWINVIIHILFILIVGIQSLVPYSNVMHHDLKYSYQHLIDISWICALGSLIFNFFADIFSSKFVANTKIIFKGNYLFIRLFISQLISELIVTLSYFMSFLTNGYSFMFTLKLIISTVVTKSVIAIIMYPIAKLIIIFIKKVEKFDAYDTSLKYTIMAFFIHFENILFAPLRKKNEKTNK